MNCLDVISSGLARVGLLLVIASVGCAAAPTAPTIDPTGPEVRVRVQEFEIAPPKEGEESQLEPTAVSILSGRICAIFVEVGGQRMNCLTDEDLGQLMKATAWRETLGQGCDQESGEGCEGDVRGLAFDLIVRGNLARVEGDLVLDLAVLRIDPPDRVAGKRIRSKDIDGLLDEVEQTSRQFAGIILGAK